MLRITVLMFIMLSLPLILANAPTNGFYYESPYLTEEFTLTNTLSVPVMDYLPVIAERSSLSGIIDDGPASLLVRGRNNLLLDISTYARMRPG